MILFITGFSVTDLHFVEKTVTAEMNLNHDQFIAVHF